MSSLGDLLLGKPKEKSPDVKIKPEHHEESNVDRGSEYSASPQDDGESNHSQKVFPQRIVKNEVDVDEQSNASSTDDYVRELLDPNDRPRNVWHVVEGPKVSPNEEEHPISEDDQSNSYYQREPHAAAQPDSYANAERILSRAESERSGEAFNKTTPEQRCDNLEQVDIINDDQKSSNRSRDKPVDKPSRDDERERSSSRRHHSHKHDRHSRDKDHGRERVKDRDRHYSRHHDRDRVRDYDRSDRHRSSRRKYDYSDDEYDDDDRSKRRGRGRNHRRSRSRSRSLTRTRERSKSDSQSPMTKRNSRTILIMQLSPRVSSSDLEAFFLKVGRVREVRLIMDSKTRRHKGIAYIEFEDAATAAKALAFNGQKFLGAPMIIQSALSDKYRSDWNSPSHLPNHATSHSSSRSNLPPNSYRVYVGGLHVAITEDMVRSIFEPFGHLIKVELIKDRTTGASRGYGFVTFANIEDGQEAVRCLDGFELACKNLRVSKSTEKNDH